MAREVSVKITANTSGFNTGLDSAASKARQTAKGIADSFGKGLDFVGKNKRKIDTLGSALGGVGLVAAVGVGAAIKSAADFDKAMSAVAATGADAKANMSALRDAAIKAGADTKFSATEAAGGVEALAKAGVSAQDTLGGGLSGALNLAAAGNLDVGASAEVAASAMNQFGLSGKDIPHIADLLAQAAGTAQGEVSDMAAALNQSGLVANQFGLSVDETAQSLALFAKSGLVGSDAGTSFKTMRTSLYAPTTTGAKVLKDLGVSAYDASGQMKPIGVLADDLKGKLDGLSAQGRNNALKSIFGSDALRAGTILLSQGSAGLSQMATDFGKFGTAADVARTKMDNLSGDLEQFKGSAETALIGLGESGQGPLRSLVQGATGAINAFNDLGDSTKSGLLAAGAGIATLALSAAGIGKIAIFASEAKSALKGLGVSAKAAGIAMGAIGVGLAVGAAIFAHFSQSAAESKARVDDLTASLLASNGVIDTNIAQMRARSLEEGGALKAAQDLGISIDDVTQASLGNVDAQARVNAALRTGGDQYTYLGQAANFTSAEQKNLADNQRKVSEAIGSGNKDLNDAQDAYNRQTQAAAAAGAATSDLGAATADTGAAAAENLSALGNVAGAIENVAASASASTADVQGLTDALFGQSDAATAALNSLIDYNKASKKNDPGKSGKGGTVGGGLSTSKASGQKNIADLEAEAAAIKTRTKALIDSGAPESKVLGFYKDAHDKLVKHAEATGADSKTVKKRTDALLETPKEVKTNYELKVKADQQKKLDDLQTTISKLPPEQRTEIQTLINKGDLDGALAKVKEFEKKRQTEIDIQVQGAENAGASIGEAARDRRSNITVDASGAPQADAGISEAARDRRAAIDVSADGVPATNAQINTTARPRKSTTHSTPSGVGATNSKIDTTQRGRNATTRSKSSGVPGTNAQIDRTARPRTARITATASTGAANAALNAAARHREAVITVKTNDVTGATGGLMVGGTFAMRGPLHRSNGGPVWGAGTATSDSIPALLSNGEFVINAKSVRTIGADRIAYMNRKGEMPKFATGGPVGFASGGKAKKPSGPPPIFTTDREVLAAVTAQYHVDQAKNLAERRKADVEFAKAMKKLNDTQSAALDSIKSLGSSLQEPYRSKSTDVTDVLSAMQDGAKDIGAFGSQLKQLKALGLQQGVIDQITADGAVNGGELAGQIIAGGQGLVDALNKANTDLTNAGTALGKTSVGLVQSASKPKGKPKKKKALGGYITGPGSGTSDSIDDVLLSNGEYIVSSAATAANRGVLDAINYGRARINEHRFMPAYAGGGYVAPQHVDRSYHEGQMVLQYQGNLEQGIRIAQAKKRDNLTMARLTGAV